MRKHLFHGVLFFGALLAILFCQTIAFATTIHVKTDGNDANSGADWSNAKRTVSAAITAASQGDQIWVAAGTYPESIANKLSGQTAIDVALYGGFAGTETALEQRSFQTNVTVLQSTGSSPVVSISGNAGPDTRVDGFVVTGGTAGINIFGSAPIITNNTIRANSGPGVYCSDYRILGVSPAIVQFAEITYNTIADNTAGNGAGIAIVGTSNINILPTSAPLIAHNVIVRNTAGQNGGGIGSWGHASPVIAYNYIAANTATKFETGWDSDSSVGPWLVGGGGIFSTKNDMGGQPIQYAIAAPTIINNMIVANGAWLGGGISLVAYPYEQGIPPDKNPPPIVTNNTIVANNGSGIFWQSNFPIIRNNLVAFNTWGMEQDTVSTSYPVIEYNDVYGNVLKGVSSNYKGIPDPTGTGGNISADPELANYGIGDLHIQPNSPCVDAGTSASIDGSWTDFDGQNRVIGAAVDIGADESDGTMWNVAAAIIRVKPSGNDSQDGLTWATAKKTLAAGIFAAASAGGEVWVAAGTYAEHITIPAFVYLYGGFAATESSRDQRQVSSNTTVIDGSGVPTVVLSVNAGFLVSALDGFTVQNGGTYTGGAIPGGSDGYEGRGAGVRSAVTSLYIHNNVITHNSLGNPFDNANKRAHGGGIHGYLTYSIIENNNVTQNELLNTIDGAGGGMYFKLSMPTIQGNYISQNRAEYGSAIYCTLSSPRISLNAIWSNVMYNTYPLPLYLGSETGAITLEMGDGFLIERNLIYSNQAGVGAGMYVATNLSGRIESNLILHNTASDPTANNGGMGGGIYALAPLNATESLFIVNNTILENTGTLYQSEEGGGIAVSIPPRITGEEPIADRIVIGNNIIAYNSSGIFETLTTPMVPPTLVKNNVYNTGGNYVSVDPGATDINADPMFVNRDNMDYRLLSGSPCVDAGDNTHAPTSSSTDYFGNPRISDGNRDGITTVDMGFFELYLTQPGAVEFDGDHLADITVWRASTGTWYTLPSASPGSYTGTGWGVSSDLVVPGDYDGDGKTDKAVWRPSSGVWYILKSSIAGTYSATGWGLQSDVAVPGDYDGDGRTDIAVYRPGGGIWYILKSSVAGSYTSTQWGLDTDLPAPGDYDGDGRTDIAVYRPGTGVWYILKSGGGGYTSTQWGTADDKPVPSDYDRDRKTDIAVWRPGNGVWYILNSSGGGYSTTQWGMSGDIPVPADYDGDARTNIAVWRPGNGVWYILNSSGYTSTQWGMSEDVPVSPVTRILN
jgi:hypothetical protein